MVDGLGGSFRLPYAKPDKLSFEQVQKISHNRQIEQQDILPMAKQLLDAMRENERLRKALYSISVNPYAQSEDINCAKASLNYRNKDSGNMILNPLTGKRNITASDLVETVFKEQPPKTSDKL